ncbi:CocE/NonD family hydrolase [Roseovarius spongiae]|uniref:CocE/NonD family hydrolase n=1 Tax=Roseovarius spongiae TaxID=2320272 RepID=A0A3A8B5D1_9RHOB|nr:CocE/NonD family hydrolase [Roseovarius spongiae]RKF17301.1 CocE/NonD family hydrolase [Roseovarius spongiae]
MKIVTEYPRSVREIEHGGIRMPDGTVLAARIWMPEDAASQPVPAILEYLPYRKNDHTLPRDAARAPYIAGHGYAYVRVDIRGCGESEGVMTDEYTAQELQDGCDVIAWLAAQDWCDGGIGMVGISWGGFNGLQIAALQPPALKAVVSLCSTDDRYADDIHYMGGAMLCEQLSWAATMFSLNTLPPDPRHVGDDWRAMWQERLEGSGLWLKNWLMHQRRDEFWKHGSICEDYSAVKVPVYAASGWADGYPRTVFRLMENLTCPRKGLVGPWAHKYPHIGAPGPAIDWLTEELRWWDQWLKGIETGIMDEPQLRLFMQDHAEPKGAYETRDGRWVAEPSWPSPNVERVAWGMIGDGALVRGGSGRGEAEIATPATVGLQAGKWCSYANPGDQPGEQGPDDADSVTFQTAPLESDLEIAGDATLDIAFTCDRPVALIAARLVDVAPDGAATRVSFGVLNLTHRDSHETPAPLKPGETHRARVPIKHVAQTFRKGHRLRLSLSNTYFPMVWPAPEAAALTLDLTDCVLSLPERSGPDGALRDLGAPKAAPPLRVETLEKGGYEWLIERDGQGGVRVTVTDDDGAIRIIDNDLNVTAKCTETYALDGPDDHAPTARMEWNQDMARGDWRVRTLTETEVTSTATDWKIRARLRAWDGDELAHEQDWSETIPRDLV